MHHMGWLTPRLPTPYRRRPCLHPGHPTAVEGCRPVSRGFTLGLLTLDTVAVRSSAMPTSRAPSWADTPLHCATEQLGEPIPRVQAQRLLDRYRC